MLERTFRNCFEKRTREKNIGVEALARALHVTAIGDTLPEAITRTYEAVKLIRFPGMQYKTDIGADLIGRV